MDYQEYENQCNEIRRQNSEYLSLFEEDMRKSSLTEKTIRRHLNNADFFINEFRVFDSFYYTYIPESL